MPPISSEKLPLAMFLMRETLRMTGQDDEDNEREAAGKISPAPPEP